MQQDVTDSGMGQCGAVQINICIMIWSNTLEITAVGSDWSQYLLNSSAVQRGGV